MSIVTSSRRKRATTLAKIERPRATGARGFSRVDHQVSASRPCCSTISRRLRRLADSSFLHRCVEKRVDRPRRGTLTNRFHRREEIPARIGSVLLDAGSNDVKLGLRGAVAWIRRRSLGPAVARSYVGCSTTPHAALCERRFPAGGCRALPPLIVQMTRSEPSSRFAPPSCSMLHSGRKRIATLLRVVAGAPRERDLRAAAVLLELPRERHRVAG